MIKKILEDNKHIVDLPNSPSLPACPGSPGNPGIIVGVPGGPRDPGVPGTPGKPEKLILGIHIKSGQRTTTDHKSFKACVSTVNRYSLQLHISITLLW